MFFEELIGRLNTHEEWVREHDENNGNGRANSYSFLNLKGRISNNGWHRGKGRDIGSGCNGISGRCYRNGDLDSEGNRSAAGEKDKSKIKYFNCDIYRHYASECQKLKRERNHEANLVLRDNDEPTLLLKKWYKKTKLWCCYKGGLLCQS